MNEPAPTAKVVLQTSRGPLEIELWAKEVPQACEAFLTRCALQEITGSTFYRVTDTLVQAGPDSGAISAGKRLAVETNTRIRFSKRGIVALVLDNGVDTGQFMISSGPLPDLNGKYSIIGRVVGDSVFTITEITSGRRENDTPVSPAVVKSVEVVVPYFDLPAGPAPKAQKAQKAPNAPREKRQLRIYDQDEEPVVPIRMKPNPLLKKMRADPKVEKLDRAGETLAKLIAFEKRYKKIN